MSDETRLNELLSRLDAARRDGETLALEELCGDNTDLLREVRQRARALHRMEQELQPPTEPHTDRPRPFPAVPGYEILGELGRGGMGVVYKARQQAPDRQVALKMIRGDRFPSADEVRRFQSEAEAAAHLDHPHIVPVYEVGEHEGQHFYSMKLIEGSTLRGQGLPSQGSTEQRRAAELVARVARAIHHAHQRGILHRDLKPANILLDRDGTPHIVDFGLARRLEGYALAEALTQTGAIVGTPAYMAPEQACGSRDLTTAADVYSLGAVLYTLLTGRPPFGAATPLDTLRQVLEQDPPRPRSLAPRVNADLETICLKCLNKAPGQRYGSAAALADDLERWLRGEVIRARPISPWRQAMKWLKRRPAVAGLLLASVLALLASGMAAVGWYYRGELQVERDRAVESEGRAQKASAAAETARGEAQRRYAQSRRHLYGARALQVQIALQEARLGRAQAVLEAMKPAPGEEELRGFDWHHAQAQCPALVHTLGRGEAPITSIAFSRDGKWLAGGTERGLLQVWDTRSGAEVYRRQHSRPTAICGIAFTAQGLRYATADAALTLEVWDQPAPAVAVAGGGNRARAQEVRRARLEGHDSRKGPGPVQVAFSPDGERLASATSAEARLWDLRTGKGVELVQKGPVPRPCSTCVSWSAAGTHLLALLTPREVLERDDAGREKVLALAGNEDWPLSLAANPDRTRLACGSGDGIVQVWDAASGREVFALEGHRGEIRRVAFSADGRWLASASADGTVKVWDVRLRPAGRTLTFEQLTPFGKGWPVNCVAFHPRTDRLVVGRGSVQGVRPAMEICDDLVSCSADVERYEGVGREDGVTDVAFRPPDGEQVVAVGNGKRRQVRLWSLAGQGIRAFPEDPEAFGRKGIRLGPWEDKEPSPAFRSVGFSKDGARVAAGVHVLPERPDILRERPRHAVYVWAVRTGKTILELDGPAGSVHSVAFSPDGALLAAGAAEDTAVWLWELRPGGARRALAGHRGAVLSVAFSPDGRWLASASADRIVRIWEVATRQLRHELRGHGGPANSVAFSPDGRRLASGSADRTVMLWDLDTGQALLTLRGHQGEVTCVAWNRDGTRLASGSRDGTVKLWDGRPGRF